ncbi:MAG: response regulator [Bacteroidia bacterium]|nr:response regulator [Bacteroidia bacterium]
MSAYHKLLIRQIRKYLPEDWAAQEAFSKFLAAVNESYYHADRDREILERAMSLSSDEIGAQNRQLSQEIAIRTEAMQQLVESVRRMQGLDAGVSEQLQADQTSLSAIATALDSQIRIRQAAEHRLLRQETLLQAVAVGSNKLLTRPELEEAVWACLTEIVRSTDASLVVCYSKTAWTSAEDAAPCFRWVSSELAMQPAWIVSGEYPERSVIAPHVEILLQEHKPVQVAVADTLLTSFLLLPIMVDQVCWGCLGFFHHIPGKAWSKSQVSILTTLAHSIGGTIHQHRIREELRHAKESAEAATRAKSEFLSTMSHEIRTPMNAVIGYTHLLLQDNPRPDQKEFLETLRFSAENLLVLINDILDYSKIEAGKVELETTDLNLSQLIQHVRQAILPRAEEKKLPVFVEIDPQIPMLLEGDPVRIGQILTNLISNAVKFTEKGYVAVYAKLLEETLHTVRIELRVTDTGVGIAPEQQQQVFERFTQAHNSTTRKFGGTGLGLTITRHLIALHGSQIQLESAPGMGSSFFFELVLPKRHHPTGAQMPVEVMPRTSLAGMRILIVEDNPINVRIITQFLKKWDVLAPEMVSNGLLAVEATRSGQFDVILMDLQMPVMGGFEAAREIRKFDTQVPIIALTADAMPEIREQVLMAGMNDYATKPFNPNILFEKISRFCR